MFFCLNILEIGIQPVALSNRPADSEAGDLEKWHGPIRYCAPVHRPNEFNEEFFLKFHEYILHNILHDILQT